MFKLLLMFLFVAVMLPSEPAELMTPAELAAQVKLYQQAKKSGDLPAIINNSSFAIQRAWAYNNAGYALIKGTHTRQDLVDAKILFLMALEEAAQVNIPRHLKEKDTVTRVANNNLEYCLNRLNR